MLDGFYAWTDATIDSFLTVDPLKPGGATMVLPYAPGQTGFFSDFAPLAATCNPLVLIGKQYLLHNVFRLTASTTTRCFS